MGNILNALGETLLLIAVVWCIHFVSLLIHELGHALAHVFATKDNRWYVEIGTGKKILKTSKLKLQLIVLSGHFHPEIGRYDSKKKIIIMLLGGPIASLLSVIILVFIRFLVPMETPNLLNVSAVRFIQNYALIYNIVLFVTSIWPTKNIWLFRNYVSDGHKIRRILQNKKNDTVQ
ncbi:MAG: site-2 protease family protein [Christensenellales bacterium]|jgi:hypothetical protein